MMATYLSQAIQGLYRESSEDRLSQIFAATFNHSAAFRRRVLRFLECSNLDSSTLNARTQQSFGNASNRGRVDILILEHNRRARLVIENKVDAPLYAPQLLAYNRVDFLSNARKIAFVKHYFQLTVPEGWRIKHWSDFHGFLLKNPVGEGGTDAFLIENFTHHLKEMGMAQITRIGAARLRHLAHAMKVIRREQRPEFSLARSNVFTTASEFLDMLEQLVGRIREEPILLKALGKRVRFTPWIGRWGDPPQDIWIGFETGLPQKPCGIHHIGTGLFCNTKRGTCRVESYANGSEWTDRIHKFKSDLILDVYAKEAILFWKQQLTKSSSR